MCARMRACACESVCRCMYVCSIYFCAWIMEDSGKPSVSLSIQFWEREEGLSPNLKFIVSARLAVE